MVLLIGMVICGSVLFVAFYGRFVSRVPLRAVSLENHPLGQAEESGPSDGWQTSDLTTSTRGQIYDRLPVLMFHYIRTYTDSHDPIGVNLSVSPEHFRMMLGWLSAHQYMTVPLSYLF